MKTRSTPIAPSLRSIRAACCWCRAGSRSRRQLDLLKEEHHAYLDNLTVADQWSRGISLFLILSLATTMVVMYVGQLKIQPGRNWPVVAGVCALILSTIVLGAVLSQPPWNALLLPLTFTAMVLTLAYNPQFALLMTFSLELSLAVILDLSVDQIFIHMGGMATAILTLRHVRAQLVQVASAAGLAYFVSTIATMLSQQTWSLMLLNAFRAA